VSLLDRLGVGRGTLVVLIGYLLVAIVGWFLLLGQQQVPTVLGIAATLLLGAFVPGTALVRLVFGRPTIVHYLALGTAFGLAFWSLGAIVSHYTGVFELRWLPSIAGLMLWIVILRKRPHDIGNRSRFPAVGVVGSVVALIGLLPALITALRSQPLSWSGWFRFYTDLSFHVAITSEAATRAPEQAPWVAGTPLSYTWLFHGSMGVWASLSGAPAASIVLQAWPVVFVALIPLVIGVVTWEITTNRWAAAVAPVLFVFLHGAVFVPDAFVQAPLFQISPTRDFADVFILIALLSLVRLFQSRDGVPENRAWWLVLLGVSVFVATGAKGSALPILLGSLLCGGLYLLVSRTLRRRDFVTVAVFAVTAAVSYVSVLPAPGLTDSLTVQPLTFLIPTTIHRTPTSIEIVGLALVAAIGVWLVIGRSARGRWVVASLLGGLLLAGVLGLALANYPGDSQLYFWESAQPVLALALAWAGSILVARYRWRMVVVLAVVGLGGDGLWIVSQRVWLTELGVGALALAAAVYFARARRFQSAPGRPVRWTTTLVTVLACVAVLMQSAQVISIPSGTKGGAPSKASDPSAISSGQLAAFIYIRQHSTANQEVITNKHCLIGSLANASCDPRWFAVAAFTERRVLVDGWAYTQNGTSPKWVGSRLQESDGFISHPTAAAARVLLSLGVKFVYVDTREPFDTHLGSVAHEVFSGLGARVYELG
jgi:hypothetical protein